MGVQLQRHQEVQARAPQAARVVLAPAQVPDQAQAPALVPAQVQVHLIPMIFLALVLAQAARVLLLIEPGIKILILKNLKKVYFVFWLRLNISRCDPDLKWVGRKEKVPSYFATILQ